MLLVLKVEKWKTMNISCFSENEWLQDIAVFFRVGEEEMMWSANCFVLLVLVIN